MVRIWDILVVIMGFDEEEYGLGFGLGLAALLHL